MVDIDRIALWTWDARPYPAFPALTEVWADGVNHRNGHWLTGRLGGLASDELARAIAADHGVSVTAEPMPPFVSGYVLHSPTTGRAALEPVLSAAGLAVRQRGTQLHLGQAQRQSVTMLDAERLAQGDGPTQSRHRGDPAEVPSRLALSFVDREHDYLTGTVTAITSGHGPLTTEASALVLDNASARLAAERLLDAQSLRRERLEFELPPAQLALEPGDLVQIAGLGEGPFEITEIRDGLSRRVTAQVLGTGNAAAVGADRPLRGGSGTAVRSVPLLSLAHVPPLPEDAGHSRLLVAGFAEPWPGALQLDDEATGARLLDLGRRGTLGVLASDLLPGPIAVWDRGQGIEVTLYAGHLGAAEPLAVLAGSNRLAVETDGGAWEILGFAQATLVAPGRYRLTGLLRGQAGSDPALGMASAGRRVMVLDGREAALPVEPAWLGESRLFRLYAGSRDLIGTPQTLALEVGPALPLPPVHLRARRLASGDVVLSWVRRSRADGDGWGVADSPLELVPERYRLTIADGAVVRRVTEIANPTATYASAEQIADFGGLPGSFSFTIAQLSPVLGAGHPATGEYVG
ncbi:MAG: phage tail protein [Devosia sp.]